MTTYSRKLYIFSADKIESGVSALETDISSADVGGKSAVVELDLNCIVQLSLSFLSLPNLLIFTIVFSVVVVVIFSRNNSLINHTNK